MRDELATEESWEWEEVENADQEFVGEFGDVVEDEWHCLWWRLTTSPLRYWKRSIGARD